MKERGFTLIEIIVATAIFTMVVTIAVGALASLNNTSREARAMRVVMDNANSAVDAMARTMRMGIRFDCGSVHPGDASDGAQTDCPYPGTGATDLRFYGPSGLSSTMQEVRFRYNAASSSIERLLANGSTTPWERMTAPEVQVTGLTFYVRGAPLDVDQPIITMIMTGVAHVSNTARSFNIQTSISPRTPNSHLVTPP